MSMDDAIAAFRTEAGDLLELIERALLDLGTRTGDRALIDEVFRGLHTLKGSGAMFGFDALADFTHECETAFDRVRKGEVAATAELISIVLEARDHMRALLEAPETASAETGARLLAALSQALRAASGAPQPAAPDRDQVWLIDFSLPAAGRRQRDQPRLAARRAGGARAGRGDRRHRPRAASR